MADVNIDINLVARQALAQLKKMEKQTKKNASSFSSLGKSVIVLNQGFQLAKSVFGVVGRAIGSVIDKAKEMEQIETQFKVFTKSATKAKKVVQDLQEFAAKTPFQLPGIAKAAKQLLAFGIKQEDIIPTLTKLGDVAAGTGKDLSELGTIYGQVRGQLKLTGERMSQLVDAGVPIGPAIAKTMGIAERAVRDAVSKSKVSFEIFEEAFASLSSDQGLFFEGMLKMSKTLSGALSTLSDNVDAVANDVGQALLPTMKRVVLVTLEFIKENRKLIKSFAKTEGPKIMAQSVTLLSGALIGLNFVINSGLQSWDLLKVAVATAGNMFVSVLSVAIKFKSVLEILTGTTLASVDAMAKELEAMTSVFDEEIAITDARMEKRQEESDARKKLLEETAAMLTAAAASATEIATKGNDEDDKKKKSIYSLTEAWGAHFTDIKKMAEDGGKGQISAQKDTISNLAALQKSGNSTMKAIGKSASLVQIGISTAEGAIKAYTSLAGIPLVGTFLGAAAASALIAFGAEQSAKVIGFQDGGIVPGNSFTGDRVPALVNSGELILNRAQQDNVAGGMGGNTYNISIGAGVVKDNEELTDMIIDNINNATEFRNAQLRNIA